MSGLQNKRSSPMGKNKAFDDSKGPVKSDACFACGESGKACKDGPRVACSRCHRLGIACRRKDEGEANPKRNKRIVEISNPISGMVEMTRVEIVGHFGRLGMSDLYSHLFFNTFRDSIKTSTMPAGLGLSPIFCSWTCRSRSSKQ